MTTRTGIATHGIVSTTPRGEVHIHGTNALQRDLFLTPAKARSLACALLCEANNADKEQEQRRIRENPLKYIQVWPDPWPEPLQIPPVTQALLNSGALLIPQEGI